MCNESFEHCSFHFLLKMTLESRKILSLHGNFSFATSTQHDHNLSRNFTCLNLDSFHSSLTSRHVYQVCATKHFCSVRVASHLISIFAVNFHAVASSFTLNNSLHFSSLFNVRQQSLIVHVSSIDIATKFINKLQEQMSMWP
jgi:hypothetical protein